jgi:hypothetical protein
MTSGATSSRANGSRDGDLACARAVDIEEEQSRALSYSADDSDDDLPEFCKELRVVVRGELVMLFAFM